MCWAVVGVMMLHAVELPVGNAPEPVPFPHFPDRLHAYVWVNWELVPAERLAEVVGATPGQILAVGKSMGLPNPPPITPVQRKRSYITVIRRNWHLLPYEQMLTLLGWTAEEMAFTLREDDFLYIKLGHHKPKCEALNYAPPSETVRARASQIAATVKQYFPRGLAADGEPLFDFVRQLSEPLGEEASSPIQKEKSIFSPRYCSSYFMLYGDPFLETETDPYPEGYLARLAASGVDGVWLQAVLYKMAPFPWDPERSEDYEKRLENLRLLTERAKKHGIGIYLYLNEPRAMPLSFYEGRPELKGVAEGDYAAMCVSDNTVRDYLRNSVASICRAAPELAGFFTISASENLTNCWSHHRGSDCPRCSKRAPAEVIAETNATFQEGIAAAGTNARLICWDWGWRDDYVPELVKRLPAEVSLMSVSEWSIPIKRGGVDSVVGEYSISEVGPGPRATKHWGLAGERGLRTLAKVQANNTWELSSVPYIPAVENVAQHASNLRGAGLEGIMLGWTLGGCPSPNLEVFAEMGRKEASTVEEVLHRVAARRFGEALAPAVVAAWRAMSAAFREYPYHIGAMYSGPQQMGPANPLWEKPTGYTATMVCFPYDDLSRWRAVYPPEVYAKQFSEMAIGFEAAIEELKQAAKDVPATADERNALSKELDVAAVCAIHFRSVANQSAFVMARGSLAKAGTAEARAKTCGEIEKILKSELELARQLYEIQRQDSRFGFEASNHYFYVPLDLAAKVVNCEYLLREWLPAQQTK